jgi:hypothetical protein
MVLLRKIDDAIVRRASGAHQSDQLIEGFDRDEDRTDGERGTRHAIRHPHRYRGRRLIVFAQPQLATLPRTAPSEHRLAMQRMPRIVDGDLLSVVGGM